MQLLENWLHCARLIPGEICAPSCIHFAFSFHAAAWLSCEYSCLLPHTPLKWTTVQCSANQLWPSELLQRSSSPHVRGKVMLWTHRSKVRAAATFQTYNCVLRLGGWKLRVDGGDRSCRCRCSLITCDYWTEKSTIEQDFALGAVISSSQLIPPSQAWSCSPNRAFLLTQLVNISFFFSDLSERLHEEILVNGFFASCWFLKAILEALNTSVPWNIINMFPTNALSNYWFC